MRVKPPLCKGLQVETCGYPPSFKPETSIFLVDCARWSIMQTDGLCHTAIAARIKLAFSPCHTLFIFSVYHPFLRTLAARLKEVSHGNKSDSRR
jgi:hypothetical protein